MKQRRFPRTMKSLDMVVVFKQDQSRDKRNRYIAKAITILRKT